LQLPGFSNWTVKNNQFAVQPPLDILKDNFTVRIHLDNTDAENGALKVIPRSHLDEQISHPTSFNPQQEFICDTDAGGVMIMRPLLLHASNRTTNNKRRRVLHIEFSKANLPQQINWSERMDTSI